MKSWKAWTPGVLLWFNDLTSIFVRSSPMNQWQIFSCFFIFGWEVDWMRCQFLSKDIQACAASRAEDKDQILSKIADIQETRLPGFNPSKSKLCLITWWQEPKLKLMMNPSNGTPFHHYLHSNFSCEFLLSNCKHCKHKKFAPLCRSADHIEHGFGPCLPNTPGKPTANTAINSKFPAFSVGTGVTRIIKVKVSQTCRPAWSTIPRWFISFTHETQCALPL